jgi:hypothetical protein
LIFPFFYRYRSKNHEGCKRIKFIIKFPLQVMFMCSTQVLILEMGVQLGKCSGLTRVVVVRVLRWSYPRENRRRRNSAPERAPNDPDGSEQHHLGSPLFSTLPSSHPSRHPGSLWIPFHGPSSRVGIICETYHLNIQLDFFFFTVLVRVRHWSEMSDLSETLYLFCYLSAGWVEAVHIVQPLLPYDCNNSFCFQG